MTVGSHTHTHLLLDTGTARTADDFTSGSASAAAGGVTTYLDFAPQLPGQTFAQALKARRGLMDGRSHVDYGIHLNITHLPDGWEGDLDELVAAGVTSAKIYTTYRDTIFYADDWTWYQLMQRSGKAGLMVHVHAENDAIVEGRARQLLAAPSTRNPGPPWPRPKRSAADWPSAAPPAAPSTSFTCPPRWRWT